jgi:hypothetical protein
MTAAMATRPDRSRGVLRASLYYTVEERAVSRKAVALAERAKTRSKKPVLANMTI